ncbi:MAG TPA: protein translocase subunit SecF [Gemmatimonadaceae bacterium]|nr:protein translocase subunit SecF [Gemmatimonadaceae bacterium]
MLRIFHNTQYDFIRWWKTAVILTALFVVAGLGSLIVKGINYSIEFTGGTLMQLEFNQPPNIADIRAAVERAGVANPEVQQFGTNREFAVRAQDHRDIAEQNAGAESVAKQIEAALTQKFGAGAFRVARTEAVGPRVGSELRRGAAIALLISFAVTLIYLAIRFEWRFGVAAVVATGHDVLTTLAFLKIMHLEVSLAVIAAILTVLGYSLNDTIIIFDRVREDLKKKRNETLYETLNRSINETLPRSVMTHATTFLATLALLLFAGEVIRPFAWVMIFGIVTGTFSSIYIAGPVLLWIERKWPRAHGKSSSLATPTGAPARPGRDARERTAPAAASVTPAPTKR